MYWCEHCGKLVEGDEATERQYHSEVDDYEEWDFVVCEDCGNEVEPSGNCAYCGEECNPNEEFCEVCKDDFTHAISKVIDHICGDAGTETRKEALYGLLQVGEELYEEM